MPANCYRAIFLTRSNLISELHIGQYSLDFCPHAQSERFSRCWTGHGQRGSSPTKCADWLSARAETNILVIVFDARFVCFRMNSQLTLYWCCLLRVRFLTLLLLINTVLSQLSPGWACCLLILLFVLGQHLKQSEVLRANLSLFFDSA